MAKPNGFREYRREPTPCRPVTERVADFAEIWGQPRERVLRRQAARCMDCGVPFCQSETGCPIDNLVPEWNELVHQGRWREALQRLHHTNNFPEFTGRVCPAPCEGACVLGITDPPVSIKCIEKAIADRGFAEGWVKPEPPPFRSGHRVAVVGSGPAGLAAAAQLNRRGHRVCVYERSDRIGGLLVYGIPNMKLDKGLVQRRVDLLAAEGVRFVTGVEVGRDLAATELWRDCDALLLATGATRARELDIPGRELRGVHLAMDFLCAGTKSVLGGKAVENSLSARGKRVVVIGGGDTGTDCIATALRQGCAGVVNLELLPRPPDQRPPDNPWPQFPRLHREDYGHLEAKAILGRDPRRHAVQSVEFLGGHHVRAVRTVQLEWTRKMGRLQSKPVEGGQREWPADMVLLALGFQGPETGLAHELGTEVDTNGLFRSRSDRHATAIPGVFSAGDCRRGQSLVVWAIREGRSAAAEIDAWLSAGNSSRRR